MIKEVNVGDNQVGHIVYNSIKKKADENGFPVMALSVGSNEVDENWLRSIYSIDDVLIDCAYTFKNIIR